MIHVGSFQKKGTEGLKFNHLREKGDGGIKI